MFAAGMTDIYIAIQLNRTKRAVEQMRARLGLHDPNPWKAKQIRRRFTASAVSSDDSSEGSTSGV